jgi:hypothetical protein
MASIKSQDQYQKEVDALKDEMRKYTDQLSLMKETYANATHEQDLLGVQHENKTVDCLSHLDLHKRMVNMLKKLKRAMAKKQEQQEMTPTSFIEMDTDMMQSLRSMAEEYGMKSLSTLKTQILQATHNSNLPGKVTEAFRILVSDIQKEKEMKANKCEEELGEFQSKIQESRAITKALHPKITKFNTYTEKVLKPKLEKLTASMKADNERLISLQQLQTHRNRKFEEHKVACNRKKEEFEEEIKNAKGMLGALALIHKAIVNPSMATKYAVYDVEKSLRKQAAESEKEDDELGYMPKLTKALEKYKRGNKYVAPTDDEIDAGAQPDKLDKYGCNNSAGYTYCVFNKRCQRMWQEPCLYHPEVVSNNNAK